MPKAGKLCSTRRERLNSTQDPKLGSDRRGVRSLVAVLIGTLPLLTYWPASAEQAVEVKFRMEQQALVALSADTRQELKVTEDKSPEAQELLKSAPPKVPSPPAPLAASQNLCSIFGIYDGYENRHRLMEELLTTTDAVQGKQLTVHIISNQALDDNKIKALFVKQDQAIKANGELQSIEKINYTNAKDEYLTSKKPYIKDAEFLVDKDWVKFVEEKCKIRNPQFSRQYSVTLRRGLQPGKYLFMLALTGDDGFIIAKRALQVEKPAPGPR
jgi:hypothetical protein